MKFSNILLVLDPGVGNELALERAIQLARNLNAKLTVCDVVDSIPTDYRRLVTAITPRELAASVVAKKRERIEGLLGTVDSDGVSIDTEILTGKAHTEIARLVRDGRYDLVIKPIAEQRVMRTRTVSRENRELIKHSPCPVWLVNVADLSDDGCIIAALDMPGKDENGAQLNEEILHTARSIALATFRPLHVVHAWTLAGEGHLRARGTVETIREVDRMVAAEGAKRMAWLRSTVYSTESDSAEIATDYLAPVLHAINGKASRVLPDLAQQLGAGLIVMGTAARSGLSGMLIGNTSEAVMVRSDSSLLVIKQPSAVSTAASTGNEKPKAERPDEERAEAESDSMLPTRAEAQSAIAEANRYSEYGLW